MGVFELMNCEGVFFFFGGLLMLLGSIGEWIIGNTFPFVVFGTFGTVPLKLCHRATDLRLILSLGSFWATFGATLVPWFNAYGAYAPAHAANAATQAGNPGNPLGLQSPGFNSSFAFFQVFIGKSGF